MMIYVAYLYNCKIIYVPFPLLGCPAALLALTAFWLLAQAPVGIVHVQLRSWLLMKLRTWLQDLASVIQHSSVPVQPSSSSCATSHPLRPEQLQSIVMGEVDKTN